MCVCARVRALRIRAYRKTSVSSWSQSELRSMWGVGVGGSSDSAKPVRIQTVASVACVCLFVPKLFKISSAVVP